MKSRSILVRLPGYPFTFEALMPDHELASTAACLLAEGHETVIRDFGTVGLMDRLFPAEVRTTAHHLADRFLDGAPLSPMRALHTMWQLRAGDRAFQARQTACCEELADKLTQGEKVDFIALKVDHSDDLHSAILLAKQIHHRAPGVCLAAFGRAAALYARELVSATNAFDCVCTSDPEIGIPAWAGVVHRRDRWPTLPNLVLPGTDRPCHTQLDVVNELDALPEPVYDSSVYRAMRNNRKLKLFPVEDSRGCVNTCNDCPESAEQGALRVRAAGRVSAHMANITAEHGTAAFRIVGAGAPMSHAADIARTLVENRQKAVYSRSGNLPGADSILLPILARSGCLSLTYHVGSGSQRLLRDYFGQLVRVSDIEALLRACRNAGIAAVTRFVYPTPADDHHTCAETVRLLERTRPQAGLIELPAVLPRSQWYQQPWRYGYALAFGTQLRKLLRTRTRFGAPRSRWRSLPFRMGDMTPAQVIQTHETMIHEVESLGVAAYMLEQTPLVAHVLGWQSTLVEFRTETLRRFLTGDVHGIARIVKDFNTRASASTDLGDSAQLRAAVGN